MEVVERVALNSMEQFIYLGRYNAITESISQEVGFYSNQNGVVTLYRCKKALEGESVLSNMQGSTSFICLDEVQGDYEEDSSTSQRMERREEYSIK
ncbi:hypothetical protein A2U01_0027802, partial [Trifolium medium]|nr:hypothetical protein [Trifolium medium]